MSYLLWATIALLFGLALAAMEVFIPSGGVLGFLSFCALGTAIVLAFFHTPLVGGIFLAIVLFGVPIVILVGLQWFPYTPVGRRIILSAPEDEDLLPDSRHELGKLVGKVGKAKSKMLPSGAVVIDNRSYDAVSDGMPIDPGQLVKVIEVRGNRMVVRPIDEAEILEEPEEAAPADDLAQPLDSIGLDPYEDPLA